MPFVAVIFKNLLRRRTRSTLTALGIAMAVAATVTLVSFSRGLEDSAGEVYAGHGIDLMVVRAGVTERMTSSLDERLVERLAALPGVAAVNASLTDMVSFGAGGLVGMPVHGWHDDGFPLANLRFLAGRLWQPADRRPVLVGRSLAATLEKVAGDTLNIEGHPFTIVGTFAGANTFEDATAVVRLTDLQELMERPGQVTEFQLKLGTGPTAPPGGTSVLCKQIAALTRPDGQRYGLAALPTQEYISSSSEIRLAHAMAKVTSIVALVIGATAMLNTMMMSVLERTQEIGVLRAIGWRKSRVVRLVLGESLALSLFGGALGLGGAWLLVAILSRTAYVQNLLRAELPPSVVVTALAVTLAIGFIGGLYPASRAAALPLTEALRYE